MSFYVADVFGYVMTGPLTVHSKTLIDKGRTGHNIPENISHIKRHAVITPLSPYI